MSQVSAARADGRRRRIAVVGAGPIGLEAALYGIEADFDVEVFERGRVAEHVRQWGHVRLFSPFGLNASDWGRRALKSHAAVLDLPGDDALLTGREFVERYLAPLCRLPQLDGRVHEATEVLAIGRSRIWKGDLIGRPSRGDDPFQLLVRDQAGERIVRADVVFDCSGTYGNPNRVGAGGIPCVGESSTLSPPDYCLPDILGADKSRYQGKTTLVIGGGYSAATVVVTLAELAGQGGQGWANSPKILWITRSRRTPPIEQIENDPLVERDRLARAANALALDADAPINWRGGRLVRSIGRDPQTGRYRITVETITADGYASTASGQRAAGVSRPVPSRPRYSDQGTDVPRSPRASMADIEEIIVDRVIANVGYRPDRWLYEELQVHECYATSGPMKLAAALLGETSSDCIAQTGHGAGSLENPEPGFFILGAKSYGRDSRFLLKVGIEQIRDVFSFLVGAVAHTGKEIAAVSSSSHQKRARADQPPVAPRRSEFGG